MSPETCAVTCDTLCRKWRLVGVPRGPTGTLNLQMLPTAPNLSLSQSAQMEKQRCPLQKGCIWGPPLSWVLGSRESEMPLPDPRQRSLEGSHEGLSRETGGPLVWFLHWPPLAGMSPRACLGAADKIITLVMSSVGAGHPGKQKMGSLSPPTSAWLKTPTLLREPPGEPGAVTAVKLWEHRRTSPEPSM